ncbi:MAG TPA: acyl-CoA dehydrogenase family protein [Stellaceae bacterium]|jgi:alkylation response protein AidB-like acyl-CoA dehydrogenase
MAAQTQITKLSTEEALARAAALTPLLRERSKTTNEMRRMPAETMAALVESGLTRILQPARYGGLEGDLETFARIVFQLARGDGSAGWVYSVLAIHSWLVGMFPNQAQQDVWGKNPDALVASSFLPGGKCDPVAGGYRVTGKWGFSSGCESSDWVIIIVFLGMKDGKPPLPDLRMLLAPLADCTIDDDWQVLGLRGTGSKSVVIRDLFIPEHRAIDFYAAREGKGPGRTANPGPLFSIPAFAIFPICLASPAVGIGWGAIDRFQEHVKAGAAKSTRQSLASYPTIHMRFAEASAMVDAAELLLRRDLRETMDNAIAGKEMTQGMRIRGRRDHGYATLIAGQAVEKLFRACGATGIFDSFELQTSYRDANATMAHLGTNWDIAGSAFGSTALGGHPGELWS